MSVGARVSKPGFDVTTAAMKDRVFDSASFTLKSPTTLNGTITFSSDTTTLIAHGKSYIPGFFCFIKLSGETKWRILYEDSNGVLGRGVFIDAGNLNVIGKTGDVVRYFILVDPVQETVTSTKLGSKNGIEISKTGINIEDAQDYQLGFSSEVEEFMIYNELTLTVNQVGGGAYPQVSANSAHGLSYPPAFYGYITAGSITGEIIPYIGDYPSLSIDGLAVEIFCDATNIWASVDVMPGGTYDISTTWTIKAKVLQNSLT